MNTFNPQRFLCKRIPSRLNIGLALASVIVLPLLSPSAFANGFSLNDYELTGKVSAEQRLFFNKSDEPSGGGNQLDYGQTSLALEPELYWGWNNSYNSLTFTPYFRQDAQDNHRTHFDIRELSYIHASDDWELRAGIRKVFWGVTEFQHVVDVINQTDAVEDIDGEDKLGQLMVNYSSVNDWGIVDIYLLPGFRERSFVGEKSRLRPNLLVDDENVQYSSSAKENHVDFAIRWSQTLGDFDVGSYWFHGTNREPTLSPVIINGVAMLQQHYGQMNQVGVDVQATIEDWLWKFEAIYRLTDDDESQYNESEGNEDRNISGDDFFSGQAGFEYSFIGVFDSIIDVGLLMEYGFDSRGEPTATDSGASNQNDLYIGSRIAFNDMQSSEILMGIGTDLDHNASSFLIEGNRRLGENFKVSIDMRLFQSSYEYDFLHFIDEDDHIQIGVDWYF